ncbi:MAG: hypothetical protein ABI142_02270 [Bryocella sp.]
MLSQSIFGGGEMSRRPKQKKSAPLLPVVHSPGIPQSDGWLHRNWKFLVGCASILGFLLVYGQTSLHTLSSVRAWARSDAKLTGTWTNDGEYEVEEQPWYAKAPGDVTYLTLVAKGGILKGWIYRPDLCQTIPWSGVRFEGENSMFGARGEAVDDILGKRVVFARLELSLDTDHGTLHLKNSDPGNSVLPQEIVLGPAVKANPNGSTCKWLLDQMLDAAKKESKSSSG